MHMNTLYCIFYRWTSVSAHYQHWLISVLISNIFNANIWPFLGIHVTYYKYFIIYSTLLPDGLSQAVCLHAQVTGLQLALSSKLISNVTHNQKLTILWRLTLKFMLSSWRKASAYWSYYTQRWSQNKDYLWRVQMMQQCGCSYLGYAGEDD